MNGRDKTEIGILIFMILGAIVSYILLVKHDLDELKRKAYENEIQEVETTL